MKMLRVRRMSAVTVAVVAGFGLVSGPASALPEVPAPGPAVTTPAATTPAFTTPNTDNCPNRTSPSPAIDLSEVPRPGEPTPRPLPVPRQPVGGGRLGACGVVTPVGAAPLPADIAATAWVLADLDSGAVLAAKDPHGRYRPASTIKMLLVLVALHELDPDKTVTATAADANVEGSAVGIGKNGQYTIRQLLQGLVMASGNDAAHALAAQLGGDAATVEKMNTLARELGAFDTRTATVSGLDGPGMSSSPYDLALIFREGMRNPTFAALVSTESTAFPGFPRDPEIPDDQDRPAFALANDNQLLYNYAGALGGKTGFTDDARHTFVGAAQHDGRRLVVALAGGEARPVRPWEQAARLLDFGFALDRSASVGSLVEPGATVTPDLPALAAPPDTAVGPVAASASDPLDSALPTRIGIGIVGCVVVLGLLLGARALSKPRRR